VLVKLGHRQIVFEECRVNAIGTAQIQHVDRVVLASLQVADGKHGGAEDGANSELDITICRTILEQHGSALHIDARPGSGTTVWFELPEID
jgi:light-regulated signal transduction histidine kinase (bacteriophytochrome)